MTREEAINQLQDAKDGYKEFLTDEALDMAIQALEQEPSEDMTIAHLMGLYADKKSCEDAISRTDLIRKLQAWDAKANGISNYAWSVINDLPSVTLKENTVFIPDNATNGDVIKATFPNIKVSKGEYGYDLGDLCTFDFEWWNAPYKKNKEENIVL